MTEDPGDGYGERVVTHSLECPQHPEHYGIDQNVCPHENIRQVDQYDVQCLDCGLVGA